MTLRSLWRSLSGASADPPPPAPLAVAHAVLGELWGTVDLLEGRIVIGETDIELSIVRDDQSMVDSLVFAEGMVAAMPRARLVALDCIADAYLDLYNTTWRVTDVRGAPGQRIERIEHPELSREAFISRLRLTGITITGGTLSELWFDCGEMFCGHTLYAESFGGVAFADPSAHLFG